MKPAKLWWVLVALAAPAQSVSALPHGASIIRASGDLNGDGRSDYAVLTSGAYRAYETDEPECRHSVLRIEMSASRSEKPPRITTSAPFVEDCRSSPSTYELSIHAGTLILRTFQETSSLRLDASFRLRRGQHDFRLVELNRYVIYPEGAGRSELVRIDYVGHTISTADLNGRVRKTKRFQMAPVSILKYDAEKVYYPDF